MTRKTEGLFQFDCLSKVKKPVIRSWLKYGFLAFHLKATVELEWRRNDEQGI
jgi:hypothetical protein